MASRRRLRRKSCTNKKAYTTQASASAQSQILKRGGIDVHSYKCDFANHWHIGHRPAKLSRLIDSKGGLTSPRSVGRFKRL